jgi:hypothetical protein
MPPKLKLPESANFTVEARRLNDDTESGIPWKKWGPYLSERQWGTVREDYSENGDAWNYFSHEQSRSRAYRWGEDGIAGISDDQQNLCFALALWNGKDPIIKERLFGLTNSESNHGEDVKEYYFYLDSTPTHSYMKYLYKYPQAEYPWYASWDLAFHVLALTLVDPDFGKQQLRLMLQGQYMHPNGMVPAYEWNFSDVNPPVLAWSTIFTYRLEKLTRNMEDTEWLSGNFMKLLLNFTWWVNRKDRTGRNVFEGGFLGLDNIGVFDRSAALPTGGYLEQADGTAWMALFSQNMLEIAVELALKDKAYADMAIKFTEHFLWIASSMIHLGDNTGMWDEEDGFFYDVLRLPDGRAQRLKVRSMVGLLPLCAATVFDEALLNRYPELQSRLKRFLESRQDVFAAIHNPVKQGAKGRRLASILDETRLRRVLSKMLEENEFLGPCGIRSLSRFHAEHPFHVHVKGQDYTVAYLPGESDSGMFGGNSNWRGPVWMPVNALIIRALLQYYAYYGDEFRIECPTGSGNQMNLYQVAREISRRLSSIFLKNDQGQRPVYGGTRKFQEDPHWRDCILFYEYFHGDNGAGIGASHQTGWTGIIARSMHLFATTTAEQMLELGKKAAFIETDV